MASEIGIVDEEDGWSRLCLWEPVWHFNWSCLTWIIQGSRLMPLAMSIKMSHVLFMPPVMSGLSFPSLTLESGPGVLENLAQARLSKRPSWTTLFVLLPVFLGDLADLFREIRRSCGFETAGIRFPSNRFDKITENTETTQKWAFNLLAYNQSALE